MAETPNQIGPYALLAELGRGGMGVVYRARDTRLQREVALKVINEAATAESDLAARFRREAQAAAKLAGHPNIVGVHDIGEDGGTLYLAMELIQGGTSLEDLVLEGELTPVQSATLMATLARAVHHAHTQGILHRDLKPANVLVTPGARPGDLEPHVTDFGLARAHAADAELTRLTTSGELLGTPSYMSPEQARGEEVDARTDVYALGATLYEMLAGRPPFQADSVTGTLMKALREPPKPLRQVVPTAPKALDAIVTKALEKERGHRYATAGAMAEDLERFVRGDSVVARIPDPITRAARWARRRPLTIAIGALVLAGGAFGAGVWWSSRSRDQADAAQLTSTARERTLAERAARLSSVYTALVRDTAVPLRALEDHWHGLRTEDDPRPAALAAVRAATDAARAAHPDLRLPGAWAALAQFFAGEEEAALAALAAARAEAGDDPFPVVCSVQALLARYARTATLPPAGFSDSGFTLLPFRETKAMEAWRAQSVELLRPLEGAPIWDALTHGTEASRFVAAIGPFAERQWIAAAAPLESLLDDPLLGGVAGDLRGLALYLAKDLDGAAAVWGRMGERGWPHALRDAGLALAARADAVRVGGDDPRPMLERAGAMLDRAIALDPGDLRARNARGIVHRSAGDAARARRENPLDHYEAAAEAYTGVIVRAPGAVDSISNRGRIHRAIGDWMLDRGRDPRPHYAAALKDFDDALNKKPDYLTARRNRANCRKALARALREAGRDPRRWFRDAIADYDVTLAVAEAKRDPRNYMSRGSAYRELAEAELDRGGDPSAAFTRAVDDISRWLDVHADDPMAWYERARASAAQARWVITQNGDPTKLFARAFADFGRTQQLRNNHSYALHEVGKAHRRLGLWLRDRAKDAPAARAQFELAVQASGRAVELRPRERDFRIARCAARQTLGDAQAAAGEDGTPLLQLAIEDCNWVLDRNARDLTARQNRARLHWRMAVVLDQDPAYFGKAVEDFEAAVRLRPRDVASQYMVGKCRQKLKQWDAAIAAFERTLALDPDHRYAGGRLTDCRAAKAAAEKK
jgi:serine/threonine-protein kinase